MAEQGTRSSRTQPRATRTSGACVACRSKKQKCSGGKPQCAQCRINDIVCQWPRQQKRGPPKHYTSTLERRLVETEDVLFALISQVSEDQLVSAFAPLHHHQPEGTEGYSGGESLFEAIRKQKFGPAYWTNFPLGSAQDVRQWWADRESLSLKGSHHPDADNEGRGDGAEKQLDTSEVDGDLESPVLSLGDRVEQEQEQEQDWGRREASASRSAGSTHDSTTTTFSPRGAIDQEETAARARTSQALPSGEEDENMESAYLW